MKIGDLIHLTESKFEAASVESDKTQMIGYMKNHFDFYGVKSPARKEIQKELKPVIKSMEPEEVFAFSEALWTLPQRELQYLAVDLLVSKKKHWTNIHLPRVEKLITTKSWWDSVDSLAPNIAGSIFSNDETIKLEWIEKWNESDNMWLNRSAIIHQLRYGAKIDLDLLFSIIETHIGSKEFFINKACGWGLRQASKFYPSEIKSFIETHDNLSNLTKKEGSKYI